MKFDNFFAICYRVIILICLISFVVIYYLDTNENHKYEYFVRPEGGILKIDKKTGDVWRYTSEGWKLK